MKIIEVTYEDGLSLVKIQTEYGNFIGDAWLNPEDEDYASEKLGREVAHSRALKKYLKAKREALRNQMKALENFEKRLKCLKEYNHNSIETRKLRGEIGILKKEYNKTTGLMKYLNNIIFNKPEERIKLLKKIEEKKQD